MIGLSIDRCAQKREKKKEANRLAEGWKRKQAMRSALSYLYSYRCMGKVGNLLARPPPSLPLPIFNPSLLLLFQRPTLAASSPAINTKNSQGQTAPPRFIAYEFSDLSIAATCLSPVTADPHLPSRASVSSAASRSGATYFPGTNAMNHACPRYECSSADIRSGCSVPATIRDFSISCIFTPWFRYVFQKERRCFFCSKTIKSYLFGNGWIFVAAWEENSLISNSLLICGLILILDFNFYV